MQAEQLTERWLNIARDLADRMEADQIMDYCAIGNELWPQIERDREWMDSQSGPGIEAARGRFNLAHAFIADWPRTDHEHIAAVRAEIAAGRTWPARSIAEM